MVDLFNSSPKLALPHALLDMSFFLKRRECRECRECRELDFRWVDLGNNKVDSLVRDDLRLFEASKSIAD